MYSHETFSLIFGIGVILMHLDILGIIGFHLFAPKGKMSQMVKRHALKLVAGIGLLSIVGSLTYSELLNFAPCKLCWFQRIFLYPSFIIGLIGYSKRDQNALRYTLALSAIGIVISSYHYFLQMSGVEGLPCSTVGQSDSCGGVFVKQFGYITIPLMAWTLNLYIIVVSYLGLKQKNES